MSYINVLISFLSLSFIIFFHELGHFFFCRYFGVRVEVFSIGFGGSIFSYKDKYNTNWVFGAFTFGGYVLPLNKRLEVKDGSDKSNLDIGIEDNHPLKNIVIFLAGPGFNFVLSFMIILFLALSHGIPEMKYEIASIKAGSIAEQNDFRRGDVVVDVLSNENGKLLRGISLARIKEGSVITVLRGKSVLQKRVALEDGRPFEGLGFKYSYKKCSFPYAVYASFQMVVEMICLSMIGIVLVFKSLFLQLIGHGAQNAYQNLSGTIGIIQATNQSLKTGFIDFLVVISRISVAVGVCNLLPIPVLDGGQILINLAEWIAGRKLNQKFRDILVFFGVFLMATMFSISTLLDFYRLKNAF